MSAIAAPQYIITLLCLWLVACAPARQFDAVPQQGANRSGHYPRFADKPQAQTVQLTSSEHRPIAAALDQEKQAAKAMAAIRLSKDATLWEEAARQEVAQTLNAIEQGDKP